MDLTTQLYFLWTLVLATAHLLPGQRDPGPPDLHDPLHLYPRGGLFDHHPPGPGFGHHHRDHGMLEDFLDPLIGNSNERNEGGYNQKYNKRVTTDNTPLRVNLLADTEQNNTVHKNDIGKQVQEKENLISLGNTNTQPVTTVMPPTLPAKEAPISKPYENKNVMPSTLRAKVDKILRTNENKTVTTELIDHQISKSNDNATLPGKLNASKENSHSGDSIIFPDNVEELKSKLKDTSNNRNKTDNHVTMSNILNVSDKVNMTKNRDGVFIPVQAVPVNPVQDTNGKFLLIPINPSGNQPLPITNDVFPNRSPVYTTVRPGEGPLYTSIVNAVPSSGQTSGAWNNENKNYQNQGTVGSQYPSYNSAVNYPNGNNLNQNVGVLNYDPSNNVVNNLPINSVNGPASPNAVRIPNTMFNSNLQQPTANGYNNQPIYNNQQVNQYPARNLQNNGLNQPGVVPSYNNVQGLGPQDVNNQNTAPNYNRQTYVPVNLGTNNNVQTNPNGQQVYIIPNQGSNNNVGQPIPNLNTQGNAINSNPNNGYNNQQYILVNANQLNIPQNGQGSNIYTLQNGQLVALIPVQLSNGALVNNNNAVNQMTPVNSNVQPNYLLPNTGNSQPNLVTMNSNTNQPNLFSINGNTPNGAGLLNGQTTNLNGQSSLPNGPIILNGQTSNLNGQNSLPNGSIILNGANVLGNGQNPMVNNGQNLYTMVTVPNNYVSNVGGNPGYQVPSSSANLVNTRDKVDKEDSSASGNNAA